MSLRSAFHNLGRVIHDASFVLQDTCPPGEKIKTLSQLARIGLLPTPQRGGSAVVGRRNFRIKYLDHAPFWEAYHEIFMRQIYFFRAETDTPFIVDCGANVGVASLYFKTLYPRCTIEAFEPDPLTFSVLKENISFNSPAGINLHQGALWDSEGEVDFYTGSIPGSLGMSAFRERLAGDETKVSVPAVCLSRFLEGKNIDFLKLDVEGAEGRVLCDLEQTKTLGRIRQMVIDYHHPGNGTPYQLGQLLTSLEERDFACEVYAYLRPQAFRDPLHEVLIFARRKAGQAASV
ncbi:MAG TPA: FkbM family methyltransferase [Candidatus Sulfotelmatobacter sp.]|jgi:FkbM family methyltransferase|nr:FkbM family methyltransferase [Candidatus Sulfotelmatobacter sp.]